MGYVNVILSAVLFFPFIACLITIPYMIYQYHKYGSLPVLRVLIVYSFILYLLIAYFLVILPLPDFEVVKKMTGPMTQLIPFQFVIDIIEKAPRNLHFITSAPVYQVLYNLILTLPFGVYLRYYFKQDFKHTVMYSFFLSLFFELTQLSGLYFIYPRAYRLFDVDDLIINTLGGMLGYALTKMFTFFLPNRDEIEKMSYTKGMKVSFIKRLTSYNLDLVCIFILFLPVNVFFIIFNNDVKYLVRFGIVLIIYYILIPIITKGYTIGKRIVNIRITRLDDTTCKWYQYPLRYILLYLIVFGFPYLTIKLFNYLNDLLTTNQMIIFFAIFFFMLFILFIYMVINNIFKKKPFFYERITNTHNMSTIKLPEETSNE